MAATKDIVEFRLSYRIVDINGLKQQLISFLHLYQTLNTRGSLFGHAHNRLRHRPPVTRLVSIHLFKQVFDNLFFLTVRFGINPITTVFQLQPLVDQQRCIPAIVNDLIRPGTIRPSEGFKSAIPVFFQSLPLPGKHWNARGRNGRSRMILRGEYVTGTPTHIST